MKINVKFTIQTGMLIFFLNEKLSYEVVGVNSRYVVAIRKLNRRQDADILHRMVETGAYMFFSLAWDGCKDDPVYTILDTKNNFRSSHNLVMNPYDFKNNDDINELLDDLNSGETKLSNRHIAHYNIDFNRTLRANKNIKILSD